MSNKHVLTQVRFPKLDKRVYGRKCASSVVNKSGYLKEVNLFI